MGLKAVHKCCLPGAVQILVRGHCTGGKHRQAISKQPNPRHICEQRELLFHMSEKKSIASRPPAAFSAALAAAAAAAIATHFRLRLDDEISPCH